MLNEFHFSPHCAPAGDQRCDQGLGLQVGHVELAVGSVLQPPQDSLAGPGLHSPLQQLALHFLRKGMPAMAGGALPPGPGQGRVGCGVPDGITDMVVEMAEADLWALLCKELWSLEAYVSGQLKVKGDLEVAMKLEAVLRALK
uniref:Stomatin like 1 n=1 Tax=Molossus molossus TaxID=27622 RepID=A0A7J8K1A2_MOLMO|nr:stomatin like 1 [Molossus molossus]